MFPQSTRPLGPALAQSPLGDGQGRGPGPLGWAGRLLLGLTARIGGLAPGVLYAPGGGPLPRPRSAAASFAALRRIREEGRAVAASLSPDHHRDRSSLAALIAECRALFRDDPWCASIVQARDSLVVGDDVTATSLAADRGWAARAEALFAAWSESPEPSGQMDLSALARAVVREWATAGGALVHLTRGPGDDLGEGPPMVQLIPVELLGSGAVGSGAGPAAVGVESDDHGRPLRYTVGRWGPGGHPDHSQPRTLSSIQAGGSAWLVNSPLGAAQGQARSEPDLARTLSWFSALSMGTDASLRAYLLSATLALIHTTPDPGGPGIAERLAQAVGMGAGEAGAGGEWGDRAADLIRRPGVIIDRMPAGSDLRTVPPSHPSSPYSALHWDVLHVMSTAIGLAPGVAMARFIRNYHASRSELAVTWPRVLVMQRSIESRLLRPLWRAVIHWAIRTGRLEETPGWDLADFAMPPQPVLDGEAEVRLEASAVAAGLRLRDDAIKRFGYSSIDRFDARRAEEIERERAIGIIGGGLSPASVVGSNISQVDRTSPAQEIDEAQA